MSNAIHRSGSSLRRFTGAGVLLACIATSLISWVDQSSASSQISPVAAQYFTSQVQTMGQTEYANVFAGTQYAANNVTTIFLTSQDTNFETAVGQLDNGGFTYQYVIVPASISELQSETAQITNEQSQLGNDGVSPQSWGPDPATGSIQMTISPPNQFQVAELRSAVAKRANVINRSGEPTERLQVSRTNYRKAAQIFLSSLFRFPVRISPTYGFGERVASTRSNDTAPFTAGDPITLNGNGCTSGFAVQGNAGSHATYILTAGHCTSGLAYTSTGTPIGATTSGGNYFKNQYGDDFQTLAATAGALGQVWLANNQIGPVNATLFPGVGVQITFDGSRSGEVPGNTVLSTGQVIKVYSVSGVYLGTDQHQILAQNPSGTTITQYGDSGGPMFQREANTLDVAAVGLIDAAVTVNGVVTPSMGSGEDIATILSRSNTYMKFG
jgi:hypothetical protein